VLKIEALSVAGPQVRLRSPSKKSIYVASSLMAVALVFLILLTSRILDLELNELANLGTITIVLVLFAVSRLSSRQMWSAPAIYLVALGLFHFGLTFVFGLGLPIAADTGPGLQWFYTPQTKEAILLAILGFIACGLGVHIAHLWRSQPPVIDPLGEYRSQALGLIGLLLVIISVGAWFIIVIRAGGLGLLVSSYGAFLDSTMDSPLPWVYFGLGLSMALLAGATQPRFRHIGFSIFAGWALFALPIGLRGETMFPALAALVVMAKWRIPFTGKQALLIAVGLLMLIAMLREVRQSGLQDVGSSTISANPLDGLSELGSSLRPVSEVVLWQDRGDEFINGASYWAPFDRALQKILPGWGDRTINATDDERIMSVLIQQRVGPIGFSPIAEAYRNFGAVGVIVVLFLIGLALGRMDLWAVTAVRQAALGVILVPLLIQVRNGFVAMPFQIMAGLAVICLAQALAMLMKRTHVHEPQRVSRTAV
jgi:hypothetical protein